MRTAHDLAPRLLDLRDRRYEADISPEPCSAGKLYTLVTVANEKRWSKMKDQLETVAQSFVVSTKYN